MQIKEKLTSLFSRIGMTPNGIIYEILLLGAIISAGANHIGGALGLVAVSLTMLPSVVKEELND